jgi:hypothetical protein
LHGLHGCGTAFSICPAHRHGVRGNVFGSSGLGYVLYTAGLPSGTLLGLLLGGYLPQRRSAPAIFERSRRGLDAGSLLVVHIDGLGIVLKGWL